MTTTFRNRTTKIEWTQHTWNPIRGCTKISAGCDNCYAEKMAKRFNKIKCEHCGGYGIYKNNPDIGCPVCGNSGLSTEPFKPTMIPERLEEPLRWKKSRMVFVGSMGDLFHEAFPNRYIELVYEVMEKTPQHIYQVLTKRPKRMIEIVNRLVDKRGEPFGNIWHGATVENQAMANYRLPDLLRVRSILIYVSCEPLLESIDFRGWLTRPQWGKLNNRNTRPYEVVGRNDLINWVIVGGETGPGARVCNEKWVRNIYEQCQAAKVPFFFKKPGRKWLGDYGTGLLYWGTNRQWPDIMEQKGIKNGNNL